MRVSAVLIGIVFGISVLCGQTPRFVDGRWGTQLNVNSRPPTLATAPADAGFRGFSAEAVQTYQNGGTPLTLTFGVNAFRNITAAIAGSQPGDVIHVASGLYNETVLVTVPGLRLSAPNRDISPCQTPSDRLREAVISGRGNVAANVTPSSDVGYGIIIMADDVTVEGFDIINVFLGIGHEIRGATQIPMAGTKRRNSNVRFNNIHAMVADTVASRPTGRASRGIDLNFASDDADSITRVVDNCVENLLASLPEPPVIAITVGQVDDVAPYSVLWARAEIRGNTIINAVEGITGALRDSVETSGLGVTDNQIFGYDGTGLVTAIGTFQWATAYGIAPFVDGVDIARNQIEGYDVRTAAPGFNAAPTQEATFGAIAVSSKTNPVLESRNATLRDNVLLSNSLGIAVGNGVDSVTTGILIQDNEFQAPALRHPDDDRSIGIAILQNANATILGNRIEDYEVAVRVAGGSSLEPVLISGLDVRDNVGIGVDGATVGLLVDPLAGNDRFGPLFGALIAPGAANAAVRNAQWTGLSQAAVLVRNEGRLDAGSCGDFGNNLFLGYGTPANPIAIANENLSTMASAVGNDFGDPDDLRTLLSRPNGSEILASDRAGLRLSFPNPQIANAVALTPYANFAEFLADGGLSNATAVQDWPSSVTDTALRCEGSVSRFTRSYAVIPLCDSQPLNFPQEIEVSVDPALAFGFDAGRLNGPVSALNSDGSYRVVVDCEASLVANAVGGPDLPTALNDFAPIIAISQLGSDVILTDFGSLPYLPGVKTSAVIQRDYEVRNLCDQSTTIVRQYIDQLDNGSPVITGLLATTPAGEAALAPDLDANCFAPAPDVLALLQSGDLVLNRVDACTGPGVFASQSVTPGTLLATPFQFEIRVLDGVQNLSPAFTVTLSPVDRVAPTASGTANGSFALDAAGALSLPTDPALAFSFTLTDCTGPVVVSYATTTPSFGCQDLGAQQVDFLAMDGASNVTPFSVLIDVIDDLGPVATSATNLQVPVGLGSVDLLALARSGVGSGFLLEALSDNCALSLEPVSAISPAFVDCSQLGQQSVSLTLVDAAGNQSTVMGQIEVVDLTAPVATGTFSDSKVLLATGPGTVSVEAVDYSAQFSDAPCAGPLDFAVRRMGGSFEPMLNLDCSDLSASPVALELRARDASGNETIVPLSIDLTAEAPVVQWTPEALAAAAPGGPAIALELPAQSGSLVLSDLSALFFTAIDPTCSDPLSSVVTYSPATLDCSQLGPQTIMITVADQVAGIPTTSLSAAVSVRAPAPQLLAGFSPRTVLLSASNPGEVSLQLGDVFAVATDLNFPCPIVSADFAASTQLLYTCADLARPQPLEVVIELFDGQETFQLTVPFNLSDPTPLPQSIASDPALPASATLLVDGSCTVMVPDYLSGRRFFSDNCLDPIVTQQLVFDALGGMVSGPLAPGSYTVRFQTELLGQVVVHPEEVSLTVLDQEAPVMSPRAMPRVVFSGATIGEAALQAALLDGVSDNCPGVVTVTVSPNAIDCALIEASSAAFTAGVGSLQFNLRAEDAAGNEQLLTLSLTIEATTAPTLSCPAAVTLPTDPMTCGAVFNFSDPTPSDDCGALSLLQTAGPQSGALFPVGLSTIRFEVTDATGLTATCEFTVTVEDREAPEFLDCPPSGSPAITVTATDAQGAVTSFSAPQAMDACGLPVVQQIGGLASGSVFPIGTTTVRFEALDAAMNRSECAFDVLVVGVPVVITRDPASATLCPGDPLVLTVEATGIPAPSVFQWRKDGQPIGGAQSDTLTLAAVQAGDAGLYDCEVGNSLGTVLSGVATISVRELPAIVVGPMTQRACGGEVLQFSVQAMGDELSFAWSFAGQPIAGATSSTLTINGVQLADAGQYTVTVTNPCTQTGVNANADLVFDPIAQDDPCTSGLLTTNGFYAGSTRCQTPQSLLNGRGCLEPLLTSAASNDQWWRFRADCDATLRLSTDAAFGGSASFISQISIFAGPPIEQLPCPWFSAPLLGVTEIACALGTGSNFGATAFASVSRGQTYYVRVAGLDATQSGSYLLSHEVTPTSSYVLRFEATPGQVSILTEGGTAGEVFFWALSFDPRNGTLPGGGDWFGLWIGLNEALTQFADGSATLGLFPPGGGLFVGFLDAQGNSRFDVSIGAGLGGIEVYGVALVFNPQSGVVTAVSCVAASGPL